MRALSIRAGQLQSHGNALALPHELRLQDAEGHGHEDESEEQVGAAGVQLQFRSIEAPGGHEVPVADGRQGDEAEVGPGAALASKSSHQAN